MKVKLLIPLFFGVPFFSVIAADLGEVETTLPGLKLVVAEIRRVDDNHAIAVVRVKADEKLSDPLLVEEPPLVAQPPPNATKRELEDSKYRSRPFSLLSSTLVDEMSGRKFAAMPLPVGMPFLGPSLLRSTLEPGSWIQLSVCFSAPPPLPPGSDGEAPDQKISLLLSRAIKPLSGLSLPATPSP